MSIKKQYRIVSIIIIIIATSMVNIVAQDISNTVLFSIDADKYYLSNYFDTYYKNNKKNDLNIDVYFELYFVFKLKIKEAIDLNYHKSESFYNELDGYYQKLKKNSSGTELDKLVIEYFTGILLFDLTDTEVWSKVGNMPDELHLFYKANKNRYKNSYHSSNEILNSNEKALILADFQNYLEKKLVSKLKKKHKIIINEEIKNRLPFYYEVYKKKQSGIVYKNEYSQYMPNLMPKEVGQEINPPILSVNNISFKDKNGNNRIDGNENCSLNFEIKNNGKGKAKDLKVLVRNNSSITGLAFSNSTTLGTIAPNTTQNVNIPITGTMDLMSGKATIKISFEEQLGFPPDPFELSIETKEFIKPEVKVVDYSFLTDNGSIKLGLPIQLKVLVQNVGQGTAENVNVNFQIPNQNVFPNGQKDFTIGTMTAGINKEIIFEFIANKLYTNKSIPVTIKISEKLGKFSKNKQVTAEVDSKSSSNAITITSNANDNAVNIQVASLTADVDKNIPQNAIKHSNRYALIIGNEDYSIRQTSLNAEVNVAFAVNDAKIFKEYAINTLGIEERNCFLLLNATTGEMSQKIELVSQILTRLGDKGELIFYYAGHGFPDEATKTPYIIPVDVSATNLQSAIKLSDIYSKFSKTKAKRITMFLDACFTGGGRNQGLLAARGVKIKPKKETITGNMVIFTATSEEQSALPYSEKKHGIFTYYLLKKLQVSKGEITYDELSKYIIDNVSIESLRINSKPQDPKVNVSFDAQNTWKTWKIK